MLVIFWWLSWWIVGDFGVRHVYIMFKFIPIICYFFIWFWYVWYFPELVPLPLFPWNKYIFTWRFMLLLDMCLSMCLISTYVYMCVYLCLSIYVLDLDMCLSMSIYLCARFQHISIYVCLSMCSISTYVYLCVFYLSNVKLVSCLFWSRFFLIKTVCVPLFYF